jgi:hypothetical protein
MKLSARQIAQTKDQIGAQPVADSHPLVPQLTDLFGSHTFFLDRDGLEIVETTESEAVEVRTATVVKLARWADDKRTTLAPHAPVATDVVVEIGPETSEPKH